MADILVIDDDRMICDMLSMKLRNLGHRPCSANSLAEGCGLFGSESFDVVFLDVRLPDGNGLDVIAQIRQIQQPPEVIIITGEGDPDGAGLAINSGAWSYIEKPLSTREITLHLNRVLQYREEKKAASQPVLLQRSAIIGENPQLLECLGTLAKAAGTAANVLITGATGTGKELFARALHANSARADKNFVVVDCGALSESLVESTLFGHEKGAFTGADTVRTGLIKQADSGTLFLDEVGELSLAIQKKLLRVLQERCFRPLGSHQEIGSDFRLVSASNCDLPEMVKSRQFRQDFYHRLDTFVVNLPPLKERQQDIKELVLYFCNRFCERYGFPVKGFSNDFFDTLRAYHWPGNIRELANVIEQAVSLAQSEATLFPAHLPAVIRAYFARSSVHKSQEDSLVVESLEKCSAALPDLKSFMAGNERRYLVNLLRQTDNDVKMACELSGLSRSRLYARLKRYKISRKESDS